MVCGHDAVELTGKRKMFWIGMQPLKKGEVGVELHCERDVPCISGIAIVVLL